MIILKDVAIFEVSSLRNVSVDDEDERMGRLAQFKPLSKPNGASMKLT